MTFRPLAAAALALLAPASLSAQEPGALPPAPALNEEQATLLRCSAVFAIVSARQASGEKAALAYPILEKRGREYFVRSGAKLMDELSLTREQVRALAENEVAGLRAQEPQSGVDDLMPFCLLSLEASGL